MFMESSGVMYLCEIARLIPTTTDGGGFTKLITGACERKDITRTIRETEIARRIERQDLERIFIVPIEVGEIEGILIGERQSLGTQSKHSKQDRVRLVYFKNGKKKREVEQEEIVR
jgi:hypothetical protein